RWRDPARGSTLETCTILTTKANALLSDVHHRMPVILPPEHYELWLDPGFSNATEVTRLLVPFDGRLMRRYSVSTFVNRPENEGPECAREIALMQPSQQQLFGM
ncbi:MAG TPA: SOS response-associated peptidase family protein, partial [Terriglobales bacterium]|nr:SOS response-associated peptidase family protein [Terriglobales bacterium]